MGGFCRLRIGRAVGMSCIYSIISLFLENLINWEWLEQLGAGIIWGFCHSFVWLLGQDDLKTGLSGNSALEDPHVASPCGRSPWRGLGTLARFQKELSRVRSPKEPDRRYLAFSGSASEIILYPFRCPVLVRVKAHSDSRGGYVDPDSQWEECQWIYICF